MSAQESLFGEPQQLATSSQWWTPQHIARRLVQWVSPHSFVLEPSCGSGNLIAALLERGHGGALITGLELDPKWAAFSRDRFWNQVDIITGDFLKFEPVHTYGVCLMNPPYEGGLHANFVEAALDLGIPTVIGVFPHSIEYGQERDHLWRTKAQVVRRARVPARVSYGGQHSASFETVCLMIKRRTHVRHDDEINQVSEEVWT